MAIDRTFNPPQVVTIGLLDGQERTGTISRFSPTMPDLTLTMPNPQPRMTLAAERIAYIGFHRSPGDPPALPSARKGELKLHLSAGKTFLVGRKSWCRNAALGWCHAGRSYSCVLEAVPGRT